MALGEELTGYSALAAHYDDVYGSMPGAREPEIRVVKRITSLLSPPPQSMLEFGVGTAAVLAAFKGSIADLAGVDCSPEMLNIARARLPDAELVEADMVEAKLGREFDVVISMFNAINHLRGLERWGQFFVNVRDHLKPGGVFVFDTITRSGLESLLCSGDGLVCGWHVNAGHYVIWSRQLEPKGYELNFALEEPGADGGVVCTTGSMTQFAYSIEEIRRVGVESGLELVADFDGEPMLHTTASPRRASEDSSRPYFVFRKSTHV